jgi:hypothetical protein
VLQGEGVDIGTPESYIRSFSSAVNATISKGLPGADGRHTDRAGEI